MNIQRSSFWIAFKPILENGVKDSRIGRSELARFQFSTVLKCLMQGEVHLPLHRNYPLGKFKMLQDGYKLPEYVQDQATQDSFGM